MPVRSHRRPLRMCKLAVSARRTEQCECVFGADEHASGSPCYENILATRTIYTHVILGRYWKSASESETQNEVRQALIDNGSSAPCLQSSFSEHSRVNCLLVSGRWWLLSVVRTWRDRA